MLGEKLRFLNQHKLYVFSRNINKSLRNAIAHMEFDIVSEDVISVKKQRYNIENEIYYLMAFGLAVAAAVEDSGVPKLLQDLLD